LGRRRLVDRAEALTLEYLKEIRYTLVERNYRTRCCEVDLVVCAEETLIFVPKYKAGRERPSEGLAPCGPTVCERCAFSRWSPANTGGCCRSRLGNLMEARSSLPQESFGPRFEGISRLEAHAPLCYHLRGFNHARPPEGTPRAV